MKAIEKCPYFDSCDAPICPLDESKEKAIWYSDEAICKNRDFSDLDFIKTQKKISKLNKKYEVIGFFTFKMLNRSLIVKKGLEGLNEESDFNKLRKYEQNWILRHKGISNELKTEMVDRLSKGKSENDGLL
jgi:hypothetical protein